MPRKIGFALAFLALATLGVAGGYLTHRAGYAPDAAPATANAERTLRPEFALPDLQGQSQSIGQWDGQVLMVNFWATWCPPCRREIPAFIELQERYRDRGFTIVGVAIDTPQNVQDFVDPMGVNYPILVGEDRAIAISKAYGNRLGVLPYTVVVDRAGRIVYTHRNELHLEDAEAVIRPLLGAAEAS